MTHNDGFGDSNYVYPSNGYQYLLSATPIMIWHDDGGDLTGLTIVLMLVFEHVRAWSS